MNFVCLQSFIKNVVLLEFPRLFERYAGMGASGGPVLEEEGVSSAEIILVKVESLHYTEGVNWSVRREGIYGRAI